MKRELPEGRRPLTTMESADLVLRMHDKLAAGFTAGDRIEQLEELYEAARQDAQEAEAYSEELEAKLAKAVGWHPIDTAPTDEAVLICGGDVLYPFVASLNNGEWDAEAQGGILREDIAECPTHWMPLPAPPSQN